MFINVRNITVDLTFGYFAQERQKPQQITCNLTMEVVDGLGASDELSLTVDYAEIVRQTRAILKSKQPKLVETLVENLGEGLLKKFGLARSVDVEIIKHRLPDPDLEGCQVSIRKLFLRQSYQ